MTIIPNKPYKNNSKAENRVFDKLRESFVNNPNYLAFHSLNLTKHKTKKFGEADFVIVCKYGLFVLEVKGGRVGLLDGEWYTVDRHQKNFKIQHPFKQAEGALYAIKSEIESSHLHVPIGYGVIFPDVVWNQKGLEWDLSTICDFQKIKNFEGWLENFFTYWRSKSNNSKLLSIDDINVLKSLLRPNFELIEPLYLGLTTIDEEAKKLTEEQYRYLDIVEANCKVLCSGGAGTGKTFLAIELARRFASNEREVVFVCKSNWLRRYLETKLQSEFVTLSTINSLKIDMRRSGINRYDILIVDEGQDLFDFNDIELLDDVLDGGLADGEWYIFHDINNQSGLFIETKEEILELLESYNPAKVPLKRNCRNSEPILKKVQESLALDMGVKGTGMGPEVHELVDFDNNGIVLKNEINNMIKGGVSHGSITILSPLSYEKSSVSLLPEKIKKNIVKLDDYSIRFFPIPKISFSEIKNFKGLENEVIIVIDLEQPQNIKENSKKVEHYVAMSRARGLLSVIWNKE